MQIIGKAKIDWDAYHIFLTEEKEHAQNKEAGWYVEIRDAISTEIRNIIWKGYEKCGEGRYFPIVVPLKSYIKKIKEHQEYLDMMDMKWDLLYSDGSVSVLKSGELIIGLPEKTVECQKYENLDNGTITEFRAKLGIAGQQYPMVSRDSDTSICEIKKRLLEKQSEIDNKNAQIAAIEKEKEEELRKLQAELEKKYEAKMKVVEEKKAEIEK